ncbi:hypothetical protein DSECCO2_146690 [anaerobic digester metagenome]|jgi:hypothetical protein|nr:hypothetical protein [Bacteroidaceae bacterium]
MKLKRIEKISEKEYIVELDEMKFQMLILREDDKYLYVMIRAFDKQMFRMAKTTNNIEIYDKELERWENGQEFLNRNNEFLRKYAKDLLRELDDEN